MTAPITYRLMDSSELDRLGEIDRTERIDSIYSGTRSGAWVKSKGRLSDEFIVAGFTEPKGSRSGIGALPVSYTHLTLPTSDLV